MMSNSPDVLIIGGGVAGLAAAVELTSRGHSILLVEQKQRLGGRTYSFIHPETGDEVDNGQHLLMGCYHSTLKYLEKIDALDTVKIQKALSITFRREKFPPLELKASSLPAPLNILAGMFRLKSLSFVNRLKLLRVGIDVLLKNPDTNEHLQSISVAQWFDELGQPAESRKYLWDILAIGALNDSTEKVSAALFAKVLKTAFFGSRKNASMVIPKRGLSAVLVDKAIEFIEKRDGSVALNSGVRKIEIQKLNFSAEALAKAEIGNVELDSGEVIKPKMVISAVPYFDIPKIFSPEQISLIPELHSLNQFISSPILTIHLWFNTHFMKEEFTALLDSPFHWIFNKSKMYEKDEEGLMYLALVISDADAFLDYTKEQMVELAQRELARFFLNAAEAKIVHSLMIKEKRATFSPQIGIQHIRPLPTTSINNFFLAGDWTDTKLPATIEGAVQSGFECARLVNELLTNSK